MEFETDITGYGRKMGRSTASLTADGKLDGVHYLGPIAGTSTEQLDRWMPSGSISGRTMNPSSGESQGGMANRGNYWGVNRVNNVSGSGSPQIWDTGYPRT